MSFLMLRTILGLRKVTMPRKRVLITLPADAYRRLADLAEQEERVIDQQASLLLKHLLAAPASPVPGPLSGRVVGHRPVDIQAGGQPDDVRRGEPSHPASSCRPRRADSVLDAGAR